MFTFQNSNIVLWLKRQLREMLRDEYKQFYWRKSGEFRHFLWKRGVFIGKDGRVRVPTIEVSLAHECNLKCKYCFHHSPFRTGLVPKARIADSFDKWSRKIVPKCVILTGGEPLLNPDVVEIVADAAHYWQQSQCEVWTNGILLPRVAEDVLRGFAKHHALVYISQSLDTEEYRELLKESLLRLKQFNIRYKVFEAFRSWRCDYDIDGDGVPVPYRSNPAVAHSHCPAKRCTLVCGDHLYRCNFLSFISTALQEKAIGPEWNLALTHKPVTFEHSPEEIRQYLLGGFMPECSICPEARTITETKQYSTEELQQAKRRIQERYPS